MTDAGYELGNANSEISWLVAAAGTWNAGSLNEVGSDGDSLENVSFSMMVGLWMVADSWAIAGSWMMAGS